MITKILCILIGLNAVALLFFIGAYFVLKNDRPLDTMERDWTLVMAGVGLVIIFLAAVPLYYSRSTFSLVVSGFFAVLPMVIFLCLYLPNKLSSFKQQKTFADTFYKDKTQRSIASAIEANDTTLLKELIKSQDLNIQGTEVNGNPGLNYLQFAVHLRGFLPIDSAANIASIRILIANGSNTTSALRSATRYLSPHVVAEFLDAGADPNYRESSKSNPLLFEVMGNTKKENEMAILLLQRGADVNATRGNGYTPVMHAAFNAGVSVYSKEGWSFVRYLLEEAQADYMYTSDSGESLSTIIRSIRAESEMHTIEMASDFNVVVEWLKQHLADIEFERTK